MTFLDAYKRYATASKVAQHKKDKESLLTHGVWKSQKKSHSTLRAKRATFTFYVDKKFIKKCQKWSIMASFWKAKACGQTVLPDRLVLIEQKLVNYAKIQKNQMRHFE